MICYHCVFDGVKSDAPGLEPEDCVAVSRTLLMLILGLCFLLNFFF